MELEHVYRWPGQQWDIDGTAKGTKLIWKCFSESLFKALLQLPTSVNLNISNKSAFDLKKFIWNFKIQLLINMERKLLIRYQRYGSKSEILNLLTISKDYIQYLLLLSTNLMQIYKIIVHLFKSLTNCSKKKTNLPLNLIILLFLIWISSKRV